MSNVTLNTLQVPVEDEAYFEEIKVSIFRNIDGNYRWNRVARTTPEFFVVDRGDEVEYVEPSDALKVRWNIPGAGTYYTFPDQDVEFRNAAEGSVFDWA